MAETSDHRRMHRQIRSQAAQILFVYAALAGLVVWQHHFILTGLHANIYLNGIIVGVFVFGSAVVLRTMLNLRNEKIAFSALQEVYTDVGEDAERSLEDPLWRYRRCLKPGKVFSNPKLLGHIYDLTFHELQRTRHIRISLSTMQNLVTAIDQRLAQDRSLLGYLTGLSVFLGLIGTFIGLMEMVGSVGGIIGGLASADAADVNSIKRLIKDLEAPLVGMAQGFSSSLFGLFGSLVLGLVSRFANNAAHAIRHEFEAWLASISQIENERDESVAAEVTGIVAGEAAAGSLLPQLAETGRSFEKAVQSIRRMVQQQSEQALVLRDLGARFDAFVADHRELREAIAACARVEEAVGQGRREQIETRRALETTVARSFETVLTRLEHGHAEAVERLGALIGRHEALAQTVVDGAARTHSEQQKLSATLARQGQAHDEALRDLGFGQQELIGAMTALSQRSLSEIAAQREAQGAFEARSTELIGRIGDGQADALARLDRLVAASANDGGTAMMAASLRETMAHGLSDLASVMAENTRIMAAGLDRLAAREVAPGLSPSETALAAEFRSIGDRLDERFANGFVEVSRSIEAAFLLNAELMSRAESEREAEAPARSRSAAGN